MSTPQIEDSFLRRTVPGTRYVGSADSSVCRYRLYYHRLSPPFFARPASFLIFFLFVDSKYRHHPLKSNLITYKPLKSENENTFGWASENTPTGYRSYDTGQTSSDVAVGHLFICLMSCPRKTVLLNHASSSQWLINFTRSTYI